MELETLQAIAADVDQGSLLSTVQRSVVTATVLLDSSLDLSHLAWFALLRDQAIRYRLDGYVDDARTKEAESEMHYALLSADAKW